MRLAQTLSSCTHADMSTRSDCTNHMRMLAIDSTNCIIFVWNYNTHQSTTYHKFPNSRWATCTLIMHFDHEEESGSSASVIVKHIVKPTTTINTRTASSLAQLQLKHYLKSSANFNSSARAKSSTACYQNQAIVQIKTKCKLPPTSSTITITNWTTSSITNTNRASMSITTYQYQIQVEHSSTSNANWVLTVQQAI